MATLSAEPRADLHQLARQMGLPPSSSKATNASQLEYQCEAPKGDDNEPPSRIHNTSMQAGLKTRSNNPTAPSTQKSSPPQSSNTNQVEAQDEAPGKALEAITRIRAPNDQQDIIHNALHPQRDIRQRTPSTSPIGTSVAGHERLVTDEVDVPEIAHHGHPEQEVIGNRRTVTRNGLSQSAKSDSKPDGPLHSTSTSRTELTSRIKSSLNRAVVPSNLEIRYHVDAGTLLKKNIPFDEKYMERLRHGVYMDRRDVHDEALLNTWNENVFPSLSRDVQGFVENVLPKGRTLSTTEFKMVGEKLKEELVAEPTIVITCPTKRCRERIVNFFNKKKPYYLENFKVPIRVEYAEATSANPKNYKRTDWAALSGGNPSTGSLIPGAGDLRSISIEGHNKKSPNCGLKLMFEMSHRGVESLNYATLGGVIAIGETLYGMSTAHTFLADLQTQAPSSALDRSYDTDDASFDASSDTDTDTESLARTISTQPSSIDPSHFESLYSAMELQSGMVCSFQGKVLRTDHSVTRVPAMSDWVLFKIGHSLELPNMYAVDELRSVMPESELAAGSISVLCEVDGRYKGLLTSSIASIHTRDGAMNVREVLLDSPLPLGSSGAWVVRGDRICGYVVAIAARGLSCFMIPMKPTFDEIEDVFDEKINLRHVPNKTETVPYGIAKSQPSGFPYGTQPDSIELQENSTLKPGGQYPTDRAKSEHSGLLIEEEHDHMESAGKPISHENPVKVKSGAKGKFIDSAAHDAGLSRLGSPEALAQDLVVLQNQALEAASACGHAADRMFNIAVNIKSFKPNTVTGRSQLSLPKLAFTAIATHLSTIQLIWAQIGGYLRTDLFEQYAISHMIPESLRIPLGSVTNTLSTLVEFMAIYSPKERTMTQNMKKNLLTKKDFREIQHHVEDQVRAAERLLDVLLLYVPRHGRQGPKKQLGLPQQNQKPDILNNKPFGISQEKEAASPKLLPPTKKAKGRLRKQHFLKMEIPHIPWVSDRL